LSAKKRRLMVASFAFYEIALRHMSASIPLPRWSLAVWLLAFLSPTVYFLLLLLADRFHVRAPPEQLVAALLYLIPLGALLVCESVAWLSTSTVARRAGWMLFTLFGILLQFGCVLAIIVMATGYA
jgi:hypothetical protein